MNRRAFLLGACACVASVPLAGGTLLASMSPGLDVQEAAACGVGQLPAGQQVINVSAATAQIAPAGGVAGLDAAQVRNSRAIMAVGQQLGVAPLGWVVAIATASQEGNIGASGGLNGNGIYNLASRANPGSLAYPHDGIAPGDHDSVGCFQQRDSWGPLAERMDVAKSAAMFYQGGRGGQRGLLDVPGWEAMPVWKAAQSVQVSAFPTAYAKREALARSVVEALAPTLTGGAIVQADAPAAPVCTPNTDPVAAVTGSSGPWTQPLAPGYKFMSPFGMRFHPIRKTWRLHGGCDLATSAPAALLAASAGTVRQQSEAASGGFGNLTVIDHGGGIETYYAHASRFLVPNGASVVPGQPVAVEGTSGESTGMHLHFEVHVGGARTDPVPFMRDHGAPL